MSDRIEDILYQAHDEGIYNEVMNVSKNLDNRQYWNVADKFEEAYRIVKTKKEKGYENKHLDKKTRGNKR